MSFDNKNDMVLYRIEEYKQLREEIRQRDSSMTTLFHRGLIANISLLTAIAAFYFKFFGDNNSSASVHMSYFFLSPILLIIPLLCMIDSHRKDIRKIASYLQVFYEDTNFGPTWETAHNEMAKLDPQEAHDFVPISLWCLFVICITLFYYTLKQSGTILISWHSLVPIIFFVPMAAMHLRYVDSKEIYYKKCLELWRQISESLKIGKAP